MAVYSYCRQQVRSQEMGQSQILSVVRRKSQITRAHWVRILARAGREYSEASKPVELCHVGGDRRLKHKKLGT